MASKKWNILVGDKDTPLVRVPATGGETYGAVVTLDDPSGNESAFAIEYIVRLYFRRRIVGELYSSISLDRARRRGWPAR